MGSYSSSDTYKDITISFQNKPNTNNYAFIAHVDSAIAGALYLQYAIQEKYTDHVKIRIYKEYGYTNAINQTTWSYQIMFND